MNEPRTLYAIRYELGVTAPEVKTLIERRWLVPATVDDLNRAAAKRAAEMLIAFIRTGAVIHRDDYEAAVVALTDDILRAALGDDDRT